MKTYLKDLTPEEVIERLKAGEVVNFEEYSTKIKMIEGFLSSVFQDGTIRLNVSIDLFDERCYFETPDELKLEVGKCYKTRDGRKTFISYVAKDDEMCFGCIQDDNTVTSWHKNGSFFAEEIDNLDLISEWTDDDVAED